CRYFFFVIHHTLPNGKVLHFRFEDADLYERLRTVLSPLRTFTIMKLLLLLVALFVRGSGSCGRHRTKFSRTSTASVQTWRPAVRGNETTAGIVEEKKRRDAGTQSSACRGDPVSELVPAPSSSPPKTSRLEARTTGRWHTVALTLVVDL
ncbi:hypothetical protein, partial [Cupriavidus sp. AcVe19-6a]|uniref:hypothetical protein n=1 Tax=Cupriavidus sp. AcVe19-6a TaxID=2821358 RepID=UPI001AE3ADDD